MSDPALWDLGEAIRNAIDAALDADILPNQIKEEIAWQVENYDWNLS